MQPIDERVAERDVVDGFAHDLVRLELECGLEEREAKFLALAGALAVEQGRADAHGGSEARGPVDDGGPGDGSGRAHVVDLGLGGHEAAVRLRDDVGAGARGERPGLAEAGDARVDEGWVEGAEGGVVDAETLRDAGAVVDEDDIELRDEAVDEFLAGGAAKVDGEAALAAIERLEVLALVGHDGGAVAAGFAFERFDLDDVRAKIGERHAGEGTGNNLGELEDANPREGASAHRGAPLIRAAGRARGWR